MKTAKIIITSLLLISLITSYCIITTCADSNNGKYIGSKAMPSKTYDSCLELVTEADHIFEGTLTGIHFEIVDNATGTPLDVNNPPAGTDQIEFNIHEFFQLYTFYTVYDVAVSKTYKGETDVNVKLYYYYGLKEYKEDEQLKLISDLGFKNPDDLICYQHISEDDYGSHINIGKSYLFFAEDAAGNRICAIDQFYFAFGEDYPFSSKNRPYFDPSYTDLIAYLNDNAPEGGGDSKGDLTGDGEVDSSDAALLLKYDAGSVELTDAQLAAADYDGDGSADSNDAALILKYDAGI